MTKHFEREQTNQVTELTADDMERVVGGFFTIKLEDVKISSYSHGGSSDVTPE
jgi:hypothetical protein